MHQSTTCDSVRMPWHTEHKTEFDTAPCPEPVPSARPMWSRSALCESSCAEPGAQCVHAGSHALTGTVCDERGRALQDTIVVGHFRAAEGCQARDGSVISHTDARGRYSLPIPCWGSALVTLDEDTSYFRPQDCEWGPDGVDSVQGFRLVMCDSDAEWPPLVARRAGVISGRVTDEAGTPIESVSVALLSACHPDDVMSLGFRATTTTNASGLFNLTGIKCLHGELSFTPPSDTHAIVTRDLGDDGADLSFAEDWVVQGVHVALPRAFALHVTLVDADGTPMSHLAVRPVPSAELDPRLFLPYVAFTNDAGEATFGRLPEGSYLIDASVPTGEVERIDQTGGGVILLDGWRWRRVGEVRVYLEGR